MKKILLIGVVLLLLFPSCFRKMGKTHHHIETDNYTLTVNGQRIFRERQLAAIPKDTLMEFGDTVTMHDDVDWVALRLEHLSQGYCSYSEPGHFRGNYILYLELIHHPGSDHAANAGAALANLCDWGYINIDTTYWQDITVVRHGASPEDYSRPKYSYISKPYCIYFPDELLGDSVNDITLAQWMEGWMDDFLNTDKELFQFLTTHGYDTINAGFSHRQIYPYASRSYKNSGLINYGGKIAVKSKKTARKITRKIQSR